GFHSYRRGGIGIDKQNEAGDSGHRILAGTFSKEFGTGFWRSLLCLEVDVYNPITITKTSRPLKVIHRTPVEVSVYRYVIAGRALQLCEECAHKHDPVSVVHFAIFGDHVFAGTSVLGDVN